MMRRTSWRPSRQGNAAQLAASDYGNAEPQAHMGFRHHAPCIATSPHAAATRCSCVSSGWRGPHRFRGAVICLMTSSPLIPRPTANLRSLAILRHESGCGSCVDSRIPAWKSTIAPVSFVEMFAAPRPTQLPHTRRGGPRCRQRPRVIYLSIQPLEVPGVSPEIGSEPRRIAVSTASSCWSPDHALLSPKQIGSRCSSGLGIEAGSYPAMGWAADGTMALTVAPKLRSMPLIIACAGDKHRQSH